MAPRGEWDVIVAGAGHNGLACAFYLARAGRRVLVLEARDRVGGACTLEETWPGYRVSPCAYVAGLLHPVIIRDLELPRRGFEWSPASGGLFVPFEDGTSIQLWDDDTRADEEVKRLAPADVRGRHAMHQLIRRAVDLLRPPDERDLWLHPPPSREEVEDRLGHDPDLIGLLFEWSMADLVERFFRDERLQLAYLGQGVIGSSASPFDPGTAFIYWHHMSGRMDQHEPGTWGYVRGGMGMVSFLMCDAAREAGATVVTGARVTRIIPGEGVTLQSGQMIRAPVVVSNADPRATLKLLGDDADSEWRRRVEAIPMVGSSLKVNAALAELPNFTARPGTSMPHHRAIINTPLSMAEWRQSHAAARAGTLPPRFWTEVYLQTAYDPSVAPPGMHLMSVFAQYAPYAFAEGAWDQHRDEAGQRVLASIGRFCSNVPQAVIAQDVLGPPDIEARTGLSGGHIFQGECLPAYMWRNRLGYRTSMEGVFLCGACTHPGGSVIGVNGRNAAREILGLNSVSGEQ